MTTALRNLRHAHSVAVKRARRAEKELGNLKRQQAKQGEIKMDLSIFEELKAIGTSLKRIGQVLETGAIVEAKKAGNEDEPKQLAAVKGRKQKQEEPETAPSEQEDDADFVTASAKKKPAKSAAASFDEEAEEEAPAKAPPKKKLSLDDVNDACKSRAVGGRRDEVLSILKGKFKVSSVTELKESPDKWPAVIKAMSL